MTGVGSATIRACVAAVGGRKHQEGQKEGSEGHEVGSNTLGEQAWESHGNRGEGGGEEERRGEERHKSMYIFSFVLGLFQPFHKHLNTPSTR